jgi:hypothetical protein
MRYQAALRPEEARILQAGITGSMSSGMNLMTRKSARIFGLQQQDLWS